MTDRYDTHGNLEGQYQSNSNNQVLSNKLAITDADEMNMVELDLLELLSFDSYDRFFPNQDNMPTGGFGNLIALPLQHGPKKSGNSEFVDKNFVAYPDQCFFLASLKRMKVKQVYEYLEQIDSSKYGEPELKQDSKPWEKGLPSVKEIIVDCPKSITIVFANKRYKLISTY
ncbi:MAG: hypothetical protein KZQ83_20845 [gamma proteobacterium symbiont of Taylorina sp.]|nr:hypothetical protein [gamma proteobacterium symbiont of Taylorina sp.]